MYDAQIQISLGQAGRTSSGLVHAGCALRLKPDVYFPHPQWSDFVVVVLEWWAVAATQLLRGERERVSVRFMEGPYFVELSVDKQWRLRLVCVEGGLKERRVAEETVDLISFAESLVASNDEVLGFCKGRDWWSRDNDSLQLANDCLRRESSAFGKRRAPS